MLLYKMYTTTCQFNYRIAGETSVLDIDDLNIINHQTAYFTSQTPPETEGRVEEYVHVVSQEVHGIHLRHFVN